MVKAFSLPEYINTSQESDNSESEDDNNYHSEYIFDYEKMCLIYLLQLVARVRTHSPTCSKGCPKKCGFVYQSCIQGIDDCIICPQINCCRRNTRK